MVYSPYDHLLNEQEFKQSRYTYLVELYTSRGDRRCVAFVRKYYIENKAKSQIIEEMFLNNERQYWRIKRKVKRDFDLACKQHLDG